MILVYFVLILILYFSDSFLYILQCFVDDILDINVEQLWRQRTSLSNSLSDDAAAINSDNCFLSEIQLGNQISIHPVHSDIFQRHHNWNSKNQKMTLLSITLAWRWCATKVKSSFGFLLFQLYDFVLMRRRRERYYVTFVLFFYVIVNPSVCLSVVGNAVAPCAIQKSCR